MVWMGTCARVASTTTLLRPGRTITGEEAYWNALWMAPRMVAYLDLADLAKLLQFFTVLTCLASGTWPLLATRFLESIWM